jgi:hypothetical protein
VVLLAVLTVLKVRWLKENFSCLECDMDELDDDFMDDEDCDENGCCYTSEKDFV